VSPAQPLSSSFIVSSSLPPPLLLSSSLGKQPFLLAVAFLRRFCHNYPDFTSIDFATIIFYRARSPAFRSTPYLEDKVSVLMSHSDRVAVIPPGTGFSFHCLLGHSGLLQYRHYNPPPYENIYYITLMITVISVRFGITHQLGKRALFLSRNMMPTLVAWWMEE
jgi:hypothetical protein